MTNNNTLFPTLETLDDVIKYAESLNPKLTSNEMFILLMIFTNTYINQQENTDENYP